MILDSVSQKTCRFMDGNFKLAPVNLEFQQLYIIRGGIADTAATLVYCLMERLDQAAYQELLNILVQECGNRGIALAPQTIHVDFELAVINSVRNTFPNVTVVGCFYHLCQVSLSPLKMILNSLNTGILLRRHLSVDAGHSQQAYCFLN